MNYTHKMTVFLHDRHISKDIVPSNSAMRVLRHLSLKNLSGENLFVLTSATELPEITQIFQTAEVAKILRVLFVQTNVDPNFIPQMFERAELRSLRNVILHANNDVPKRILAAWQAGAQEQLIAQATVIKDSLWVTDCALQTWEIPFKILPALAAITPEKRADFEIDEDGSYLYWPSADLHLDLEALRATVDPEWQEKLAAERVMYDLRFGQALATVRKSHNLKQTDIPGISTRQIRRIEKGSRPKLATLRKFSQAHGLSVNEYLEEIAQTIQRLGM
jgi:Protein of unknown function (DUF2442)